MIDEHVWIAPESLTAQDNDGLVKLLRDQGMQLRFFATSADTSQEQVIEQLQGCRIVVAGGEPYTKEVFAASPDLVHIARFGVGYDSVDLEAATRHGVVITIAPGTLDDAVADQTMGLLFTLARQIAQLDRQVRAGHWQGMMSADVWGATIGIIGLGRIGRAVARRARGLNMRILAYELYPDDAFIAENGIELVPLQMLLCESDFVTLHTPVTADTAELINQDTLALMKSTAYIINTARGGLINETDLYDALINNKIAGAGLDTRATEPPIDSRIALLDNVVSTPHCAGRTPRSLSALGNLVAKNIADVSAGTKPDTLLNSQVWESYLSKKAEISS
jgi:D-3-phosphoglycerate dehydrogenase